MPKETIATNPNSNVVEVTWGRGPDVQISTSCPGRLVSHTIPGDKSDPGFDLTKVEVTPEGQPFSGWYADLDRESINRLIRILRRARDKAFGPDA